MITPGELQKIAGTSGVRDQQIEKDYALSWILWGISKHPHLSKQLVFKGGTVLKKVYFPDYRFSEDLDFTLMDNATSNEQIFTWFEEIFGSVKEEANIPLASRDDHEQQDGGINFYIGYTGPLGGAGAHKEIKVDISRDEILVFIPVVKQTLLNYSDLEKYELLCYPLEEVLVEKMRCIIQRLAARDFYDIWFLVEVAEMDIDFYVKEFIAKCERKNLQADEFPKKLAERLPQYKARWENSLKDQIKDLPSFEQVEREVQRKLRKLKLG